MRALVCNEFGPLESLALETVDDPTPGEGEVLIGVKAAGINCPGWSKPWATASRESASATR